MDSTSSNNYKQTFHGTEYKTLLPINLFLQITTVTFLAYIFGSLGFSFLWIIIPMMGWIIRDRYLQHQNELYDVRSAIASDEKSVITSAIKELPSWVHFPDEERAEWINKILKQLWPFVNEYAKIVFKNNIESNIISSLPEYLKSFRFEKVDLGNVPPRLSFVKVYDENTSRDEIIIDAEIYYAGNCDIQMKIKGMKAGIKQIQVYGKLRTELRPLVKNIPLIGCVSCYFLKIPELEFNLTCLSEILDVTGLSVILKRAIKEQLAAFIVLPNKFVHPLVEDISVKSLKYVPPIGVVRLEVIEAKDLRKADVGMLGMGKSDPYCNITIGGHEFTTKVIQNTVNPKWNYICEAVVQNQGHDIEIEVMDQDQGLKDDFLGRTQLSLSTIAKEEISESWLKLKDTKKGSILVRCTWLSLTDSKDILEDETNERQIIKSKYEPFITCDDKQNIFGSIATILVFLDSAKNLPITSKTSGKPNPYVVFSIGQQKRLSNVKSMTTNPIWEEVFYFLIDDIHNYNELSIDVIDNKINKPLGNTNIRLNELLNEEKLCFDGSIPLQGRRTESCINVTVQIKFLKAPKLAKNGPKIIHECSVEEPDEESVNNIPSLEEMVKGTIQPIINTSHLRDKLNQTLELQMDRRNSLKNSKDLSIGDEENKNSRIELTLERLHSKSILLVLHRAENLPNINDRKPNSYVKVIVDNDNNEKSEKRKRKTVVQRSSSNPVYDKSYEIDLNGENNNQIQVLVCTRMNSSSLFSRKSRVLGIAKIDISELEVSQKITKWFDLEQVNG